MNTKFLATVSMLVLTSTYAFSQKILCVNGEPNIYPPSRGYYVKRPCTKNTTPTTSYNSATTTLTVKFPATNGGKVEIYRNGAKVVNVNAAAGAMLSYTLRNYGRGNYTVIVRNRNTVVYYNSMNVK